MAGHSRSKNGVASLAYAWPLRLRENKALQRSETIRAPDDVN